MKPLYPPRRIEAAGEPYVNRPIIGLDVDGTLGAYHDHFIWFAEHYFGKEIPRGYDGRESFAKWMGVSKSNYRRAKLAFRRSGLKRAMPCYDGAADLTRALRKEGALVVICTSRPFLAMEVVDEDTRIWLRRNGIQYDNLIHGERKYRDLALIYGADRVVCVLEDLPEMLIQAAGAHVPSILRRGSHNSRFNWRMEAGSLAEAQAIALDLLGQWEQGRMNR